METRASYAIVGTFVLTLVAALFAFIIFIAKVEFEGTDFSYYAYFDESVTGLQKGSAVRYRGVDVGIVSDIRIAPNDPGKVRVTMEIDSNTPLTTDATTSIEMQGITGLAYIQIFGGTKESPPIEHHLGEIPVIPSRPSNITELVNAAPELLNNLVDLSEKAANFITPDNAEKFSIILGNLADATTSLKVTMADLETVTPEAKKTIENLRSVARNANDLLAENRQPIHDFTTTGLYDMALLMAEMRELVGHLSRISAQIERDPGGFILAGPRSGVTLPDTPTARTYQEK